MANINPKIKTISEVSQTLSETTVGSKMIFVTLSRATIYLFLLYFSRNAIFSLRGPALQYHVVVLVGL